MTKLRPSPTRGFTLLEMMVALGIVAAIALMAVALVGSQNPRQRLNSSALELRAFLHGARQTALSSGHTVVVMIFPDRATGIGGGVGRVIAYEDGDGDFFSVTAAVNFASYDAGTRVAGARSEVLDVVDLPSLVAVGPAAGLGVGAVLPAPFDGIRIDVDCVFCTGTDRRGAIAFGPDGTATFHAGNGPPVALPQGASLSITAAAANEVRTLVVAAPTGAIQTLYRRPTP